ncbi:MAG: hypothetical protein E7256_05955 [Lachnospiraceae bacterium]|nr:hypothetical protein [Lachnospiraceae bacterium]
MNDFVVDIPYLSNVVDEIVRYAKEYQEYVDRLESIKSSLSFEVRARAQIEASFQLLASNIEEQTASLKTLGESLKEFSEGYGKTEGNIVSNEEGIEWEMDVQAGAVGA